MIDLNKGIQIGYEYGWFFFFVIFVG